MSNSQKKIRIANRELSWLDFNERVLYEAKDTNNPIHERLKFLGIFSSNMDEFFRVRIPSIKNIKKPFSKKTIEEMSGLSSTELLNLLYNKAQILNTDFENILLNLWQELKKFNIHILNEKQINSKQKTFVLQYFNDEVRSHIVPILLQNGIPFPTLADGSIYLAIQCITKKNDLQYALVEVPNNLPRFIALPSQGSNAIIFLDDIIRFNLTNIFKSLHVEQTAAFTIKVTRDAEPNIDQFDMRKSVVESMQDMISKRKKGRPTRLVYDREIPFSLLKLLKAQLMLTKSDSVIAGGRYHNLKDLMRFPAYPIPNFCFKLPKPLYHKSLQQAPSILSLIEQRDILLFYPYHSFDHTIDLLREAALDPNITSIRITIYRLAKNSKIANALINAARNGKNVVVVMELQARFDEEHNLYWSKKFQEEGVFVINGIRGYKVHMKAILITQKKQGKTTYFCNISTGNYNEATASHYCDISLFTSNNAITHDIKSLFYFFETKHILKPLKHVLTSPKNMRKDLISIIEYVAKAAHKGKPAQIDIKLNNFTDVMLIEALYKAAQKGVKVRLIIRSSCGIINQQYKSGGSIETRSLVDRYLEHSRFVLFTFDKTKKCYLSSADWMVRNLDHRYEIATPILDTNQIKEVQNMFDMQWNDNVKLRIIQPNFQHTYHNNKARKQQFQVQYFQYIKNKNE